VLPDCCEPACCDPDCCAPACCDPDCCEPAGCDRDCCAPDCCDEEEGEEELTEGSDADEDELLDGEPGILLERDEGDDEDVEEEDGMDAVLLELELELELGMLELELLELDDEDELGMLGILDCDCCEELVDSQPASTSARALKPSNCFTTGIFIMGFPDSLIDYSSTILKPYLEITTRIYHQALIRQAIHIQTTEPAIYSLLRPEFLKFWHRAILCARFTDGSCFSTAVNRPARIVLYVD
jgi:hypothetical protein